MTGRATFRHLFAAATFIALGVYWTQAGYFGHEILAEIAVFAILAMSLDLIAGYAGLVSLGHAALFGTGAYLFAFFSVVLGWPVGLSMVAATAATGVIACVVGAVVTRVHGIFFIMITLAIGEMGHEFFFKNRTLGGDDGFAGIERLDLTWIGLDLNTPATFSMTLIVVALAIYLALNRLIASPFGAVLHGLHDNTTRMRALGLPVRRYQTSAFALSGTIAAFAGTLTAQHTMFISPKLLHWTLSGEVLVMVILGGLGTLAGPVVGAAALVFLRHELSDMTQYWGFWLGLFLVLIVMGGRNGIIGWAEWAWRKLPGGDRRAPAGEGPQGEGREAADAAR
ncbi:MAG: branched-chain amino acid ABC transporter permease [Alphaproteobacteria bacterium]|nr:branched-chain amino acid ABC transporter permease [Alphaproteobacteria bacterium]MDX5369417.1 branched-chain amino acid ABC transporter permease [Alphaproteobacteria bacterium]MDX5464101.1 branched-chain amino acid ABC transporter permease [Alphaproteobacteria bacterium]